MRLTIISPDSVYLHDVDPSMNIEDVQALIEAETGLPTQAQLLSSDTGIPLEEVTKSLESYGLKGEEATVYLTFKTHVNTTQQSSSQASSSTQSHTISPTEAEYERMRLQVLGDARLMARLRLSNPAMAQAVQSSPEEFRRAYIRQLEGQGDAAAEKERQIELLNADPYDIEAQKKIEEAIRMEAVLENMEHAMEYSPEAFAQVTMLYINVEVNGHKVKAFVDSGAQATIISTKCAEECGIMRLLDNRYAGTAVGVGTGAILGRIHSTQIKLGDLFLPVSFSVMNAGSMDLLFGLDMLKRHQACIDLSTNTLRIGTASIPFLAEHELPASAKHNSVQEISEALGPAKGTGAHSVVPPVATGSGSGFPGSGQSLGGQGPSGASGSRLIGSDGGGGSTGSSSTSFKEEDIQAVMNLGAPRDHAIQLLEASGGNVDVAASMLFG